MPLHRTKHRARIYIGVSVIFGMCGLLQMQAQVTKSDFGAMPDGTHIPIYTLQDGALRARIMTYGARIVSLEVPDRSGKLADVVLGYDSLAPYTADHKTYFGAIVGRYANRIAHGSFVLNGKRYTLPKNDGDNTLHGGTAGFDSRVWTAHEIPHGVEMTLVSKNGDQGFPGTLTTHVRYTLAGHTLQIEFSATTDADTVINLANHSYFNLSGEGNGTILHDLLTIPAERYTPINANLIPTGQLTPVVGTPLDYRHATAIGKRIDEDNEQLHYARGYDFNFVLEQNNSAPLHEAARVQDPESSRVLTVETTQPGVQFYTGNFLNGVHGKHGHIYNKHAAFCLETQHFPDSPNQPNFPSTELKPGQTFRSVTKYIFSTE